MKAPLAAVPGSYLQQLTNLFISKWNPTVVVLLREHYSGEHQLSYHNASEIVLHK